MRRVASRRALAWTWKRGGASLAELGDPTVDTDYALCVYDADGLALATGMRAGGTWTSRGTAGFRQKNPSGVPGGVTTVKLVAGATPRAALSVKGKGARLPAGLPLTLPVTAQLVTSDGTTCWEGVYDVGARSTSTSFRGKD